MTALHWPRIARNFGALISLQVANYIVPLLLLPYLARVLGMETFGSLMFAMAFVIVARICVSYGFDLTATRQVAIAREEKNVLSRLLADVIAARLLIWLACFAVLLAASAIFDPVAKVRAMMLIALAMLLGEAIFPVWLFQGMETMGAIAQLRVGAKVVNLFLVYLTVKSADDVALVPLIETVISLVVGAVALRLALRRFGLRPEAPTRNGILAQLRDGGSILVATLAVQFYTTFNMIVLGFFLGSASVGAYAIAEKAYSALRGLIGPFVQAAFPAMSRLHQVESDKFASLYRKVVLYAAPTLVAVAFMLYLASGFIISIISGQNDSEAILALRLFALSFPFGLGSFLAPMLVVRGRNHMLMAITVVGGLIGLASSSVFVVAWGVAGAVASFLIVQIFNTIALLLANRGR